MGIVLADRWYPSSKVCSDCGLRYDQLTLRERIWTAPDAAHITTAT